MFNSLRYSLAALLLVGSVQAAAAHVSLETQSAAAGAGYKAVLRVPHGCDGSATTSIRVNIPDGFVSAKPMPKAGWTLTTVKGPYAKSYQLHGADVSEGVTEIVWSGGELPDDWYDEFVFRGTFADGLEPETKVFFPVIQQCGDREEAWIDTSGEEDGKTPAPSVTLTPAEHHH